jgi:hypothetical protein
MPVTTIAKAARPRIASQRGDVGRAVAPTISTIAASRLLRFVK